MERAVRLFKNKKLSREILSDDDFARAVWPIAVGKAINAHTLRLKVVRSTLVVEVEDAIWQRQLYPLTGQILARFQKVSGSQAIQDIEFRIGIPRREPQRAEFPGSSVSQPARRDGDEADYIQDPVLKKVYRLSRKKATG